VIFGKGLVVVVVVVCEVVWASAAGVGIVGSIRKLTVLGSDLDLDLDLDPQGYGTPLGHGAPQSPIPRYT